MPICICPQCSKSHKIPAKNLGLKGRCTGCKAIFDLVEHSEPPVETPPPAPPVEVKIQPGPISPPLFSIPDDAEPTAAPQSETFSLRMPVAPPPPPPQRELPAESVIDDEWGDIEEEAFEDDESPPALPGKGKIGKPARGDVAPLRSRPALTIIATVYTVVGVLFLIVAIAVFVGGVVALMQGGTPRDKAVSASFVATLIPVFVGSLLTAVFCIACGEVIRWGIAIEARLHEISKHLSR